MKRFSEQLQKKSQTVKLKKAEQADLRDRVVSYMEYHPLPLEMRSVSTDTSKSKRTQSTISTEAFAQYKVPFAQIFKFGGAFAAIMLVVIPVMAERAVPGDSLYAVKVNINEGVRSTLTLDPYQKVEWETSLINRRIAEAKLLKKEGRLTEVAEAEAAAAVKQHADNAKAEIAMLRESDADEAAIAEIALDSTLTVQAHSFDINDADIAASSTVTGTDLIADAIDKSLIKPVNQATTSLPSLTKLTARVEQNTTRLRELETSLSTQIESSVAADVARRIADIERVAAEAFALPVEGKTQAQAILVDVLARAQRLIVFMTDLGVRETVAIETVVPVVLTTNEMEVNRATRLEQIEAFLLQLNAAEIENEAISEKLAAMTERLQDLNTELIEIEDYSTFVQRSDEAVALAKDALLLIEQSGTQVITPDLTAVASSTEAVATSSATSTDEVVEDPVDPVDPIATSTPEEAENTPDETDEDIVDEVAVVSSTTVDTQGDLDASIQ